MSIKKKNFIKKWYSKRSATEKGAIITGIFFLIVTIITIFHQRSQLNQENKQMKNDLTRVTKERDELKNELNVFRKENEGLKEIVAPLIKQAASEFPGEEINQSLKKIVDNLDKNSIYKKPILTATATVIVNIQSDKKINTKYIDSGAILAFGKGEKPLMILSDTKCTAKQSGKGEVIYKVAAPRTSVHILHQQNKVGKVK